MTVSSITEKLKLIGMLTENTEGIVRNIVKDLVVSSIHGSLVT